MTTPAGVPITTSRTNSTDLVVVISILGAVFGAFIAATLLWATVAGVVRVTRDANATRACEDLCALRAAVDSYALEHSGRFPWALHDLNLKSDPIWRGWVPVDPWGTPYQYAEPSSGEPNGRLYSLGSDRRLGGTGFAADITDREAKRRRAEQGL